MSFGFPAYHTESFTATHPNVDLRGAVRETLLALGWKAREEDASSITAAVGINWRSWGERVAVTFLPDRRLSVTSRCALPTQCLDWGRNETNVLRFLNELRRRA
jgi:hypothetical protein